jgi:hypothetical protein
LCDPLAESAVLIEPPKPGGSKGMDKTKSRFGLRGRASDLPLVNIFTNG